MKIKFASSSLYVCQGGGLLNRYTKLSPRPCHTSRYQKIPATHVYVYMCAVKPGNKARLTLL